MSNLERIKRNVDGGKRKDRGFHRMELAHAMTWARSSLTEYRKSIQPGGRRIPLTDTKSQFNPCSCKCQSTIVPSESHNRHRHRHHRTTTHEEHVELERERSTENTKVPRTGIMVLRCERVVREKNLDDQGIRRKRWAGAGGGFRWLRVINGTDRITDEEK